MECFSIVQSLLNARGEKQHFSLTLGSAEDIMNGFSGIKKDIKSWSHN